MNDTKIYNILTEILGTSNKIGSETLFFCPKCKHHKKKLSINIEKDKFKCWICDWSGTTIKRIIVRFGNYSQIREWNELSGQTDLTDYERIFFEEVKEEEKQEVLQLPQEFQSLCNKDISLTSLQARRYLKERGISKEDILFWKMGYCVSGEYEGRVIIPSFNMDGRANYFVARRYDDSKWQKYMNPAAAKDIIFNELAIDWTKDVTIVEGVFDAIKAKNAIPLLGSTLRENSRLFKELIRNDPAIYIALDPDAEKKAEKLIKDLLNYDAEVYKVPISGTKDVGDMTHQEFLEHKEHSVLIKDTDYLLMSKIWSL